MLIFNSPISSVPVSIPIHLSGVSTCHQSIGCLALVVLPSNHRYNNIARRARHNCRLPIHAQLKASPAWPCMLVLPDAALQRFALLLPKKKRQLQAALLFLKCKFS
jgi:hypothetical protein